MTMQEAGISPGWLGGWKGIDDRIALVDGGHSLTYAELHDRVAAVSQALRKLAILPGDRVALVLENSWQYVACHLGVLVSGGVVVPLNPAARERDLSNWVEHVDASLVIADRANAAFEALTNAMASRRLVTAELLLGAGTAPEILEPDSFRPSADSPAAILFTSGTTASPKGVLLSHGNLRANAMGIIESLSLGSGDSVMCVLPFTYAYGSSVLLSHLLCGGRVVIQRGFGFPQAVVESMVRERVTGFAGVPSTFALLLSRVRLEKFDLSTLRYLTQAGGAMSLALTQKLREALPGKQIFVMYGQTEATSRLTCLPAQRLADKLGSVGLPLSQVDIQIRDAEGQVRPAGETGDVWARGPGIMMGYWRDTDATLKVLRDGWLKTGDMGYLDADGFLYLAGRRSDMIKVGAHRVHPQDIEDVLAELPGVAECAVVGVDDEILGEVVKAYIVRPEGSQLAEQHVKRHCLEKLAAHKVPRFVEFVAGLPRTSSGKVQRSRLPGFQERSQ
jgi:acyl-CoA synthetase (AMP-forming)/AMP-acid ligase II